MEKTWSNLEIGFPQKNKGQTANVPKNILNCIPNENPTYLLLVDIQVRSLS